MLTPEGLYLIVGDHNSIVGLTNNPLWVATASEKNSLFLALFVKIKSVSTLQTLLNRNP